MPLAGRRRAVVEDVAEMAAAAATMAFGTHHEIGRILVGAYRIRLRFPEARPTCAGLVLGFGRVNRQVAAGAMEHALALLVVERAGSRPFRALLAQDGILLRRQQRPPLRFRFR